MKKFTSSLVLYVPLKRVFSSVSNEDNTVAISPPETTSIPHLFLSSNSTSFLQMKAFAAYLYNTSSPKAFVNSNMLFSILSQSYKYKGVPCSDAISIREKSFKNATPSSKVRLFGK